MNTQLIIDYLKAHPDFLIQQTDLLAHLNLPEPVEQGVLSMKDYQLNQLRQQNQALNQDLNRLLDNATANAQINRAILEWCMQILSLDHAQALPHDLVLGLRKVFTNLDVALRIWHLPKLPEEQRFEDTSVIDWANQQTQILLGTDIPDNIREWLDPTMQSFACMTLKTSDESSIGMLVFGSADATHFNPQEDVYFLELIAKLSVAALSRLR